MCKKLTYLVSLVLVLGSISATAQESLLLRYSFDEGQGGLVLDLSGNENNAIMHNMDDTSWVAGKEGRFGTCLILDGTNDYLTTDGLFSKPLDGDFTLSMWFTGTPGRRARLFQFRAGDTQMINVRIIDDILRFDDHGGVQAEASGDVIVTDRQWHHFAMVRNGLSLIAYLDGEQHMETPLQEVLAMDNVSIGVRDRDGNQDDFLPGKVDEFSIYAEALDIEDIRLIKEHLVLPSAGNASNPDPADWARDVPRDTILSWTPGVFAPATSGHNVFFSDKFDDVNDGVGATVQDANTHDPGRLDFGTDYFWRVDEVNATPDKTVFKGDIWSFEVEPIAIPVENVTATASGSNAADMGPEKTIDGSGLDALGQHSTTADDMWLSSAGGQPWIQYEFDRALKLHEMWVWNSNQMIETFLGLGAKDVTIETSLDGEAWTQLEDAAQFAQASGKATYTANTIVGFGGTMARFVRITINAGWGAVVTQFGLSEVRFFSIPVQAREPQPTDGASIDGAHVVLKWRAGRDAASHEVSLGTDSAALALVGTTDATRLDPGALDYDTTYFWTVDEVNQAETPARHAGNVWSFTTPPYGIVDDFDQYDDNCNRIFFAWADGLGHNGGTEIAGCEVPASNGNGGGSIVGNATAPFAEKTIVNSGSSQSMPFEYDNAIGASETSLTLNGQDWTASGVQTLSLAFYGTDGNTGILYVKVNNSKVSYDLDPADIARSNWQAWNIDLTGLGGLQNVTSLTIGVDGANAAGMLYIDDIRLYPLPGELITPAEPDDVDLLTYYAFNEGAGTIAGDQSGNGHDGTLVGPPQWAAGKVGGALQFGNGTHVLDDDAEDYVNGLSAITIAMWIKSGVVDTDSGFIIFDEPAGNDRRGIRYDADGGEGDINLLKYGMEYTSGNEEDESPANLQTTDWQHVAVTSASGAGLTLYINGTLVIPEEDDGAVTGVITGCTTLIVGKGGKDEVNSAGWDGLIDEVRIYGRALSAEEIMWLAGRAQPVHKPL